MQTSPATWFRRFGVLFALAGMVALPVIIAIRLAPPPPPDPGRGSLPDFTGIEDVNERKDRFLGYLEPIVERANAEVARKRERLLQIAARQERRDRLPRRDHRWLRAAMEHYSVDDTAVDEAVDVLRRRIDIVPAALALAQAAIETGWGRSRFAREGNNIFGEWCYEQGCGIVPAARSQQARHEVRVFATVGDSVRGYLDNLNSHRAYRELRAIRARARAEGRRPTGAELAMGLARYSERGQAYVEDVRRVIRGNDLE